MSVRRGGFAAVGVTLVMSTGCHKVFDLDPVEGPDAPRGVSLCVADDFSGTSIDATRWYSANAAGVTVGVDAGTLKIDVPVTTTADQDPYGALRSRPMDMTGGSVEAELVEAPPISSKSEAFVEIKYDERNHYDLIVQNGRLVAREYVDAMQVDTPSTIDPATHPVLRLRHVAETNEIVFEVHGDGTDWLEIHRAPFRFDILATEVNVSAGSFNVAPAYSARFDNLVVYGRCNT